MLDKEVKDYIKDCFIKIYAEEEKYLKDKLAKGFPTCINIEDVVIICKKALDDEVGEDE